jgi:hypothetical protein
MAAAQALRDADARLDWLAGQVGWSRGIRGCVFPK